MLVGHLKRRKGLSRLIKAIQPNDTDKKLLRIQSLTLAILNYFMRMFLVGFATFKLS